MGDIEVERVEAGDELSQSANVVDENVEALRGLFPEAFTEDGIDFDVLRQILGDDVANGDEKYGLNWYGKRDARRIALTPSTGTLRPCPEESVDWDTTQNLMIEGDNLEVLKLLQKSYSGKVKLIYIDPPYNTGKDFVYKDDYRDNIKNYLELTGQTDEEGKKLSTNVETSGRFHTDWLNMMYPRLKLARNLLRDDGVIFISIDDNELENLLAVCNEIFGEENHVANIAWQKKYGPKSDAQYFSESHDNIVVFARSLQPGSVYRLARTAKQDDRYKNIDSDPRGAWKAGDLLRSEERDYAIYPVVTPSGREVWPPPGSSWRYTEERLEELRADDRIWFGRDGDAKPAYKRFLAEVDSTIPPETIWFHRDAGHNDEAKRELKRLFGGSVSFETPKPVRLVLRMLRVSTRPDREDLVLDFFAGSGTTGHGVLAQNATDNGRRRFLLVQLAETPDEGKEGQRIVDLTKERLRRTAAKVKADHPDWEGDAGFRVFKLDSSNIRAWSGGTDDVEESLLSSLDHVVEGRSDDDLLYEVLLKLGLDLTVPIEGREIGGVLVSSVGGGVLMTCLVELLPASAVEAVGVGITEWLSELDPAADVTVVFRDSAFENDVAKTNMAAILEQAGVTTVRSI